jgi:hypothetical protein
MGSYRGDAKGPTVNNFNQEKVVKRLLLVLALLAGSIATAQEKEAPKVETVKFDAYCMTTQALGAVLAKYEEQPMMSMLAGREVGGQSMEFVTIMFANPKSGTWSLVERVAEDAFCVTATGTKIAPYTGEQPGQQKKSVPKKYEQQWVQRDTL